MQHLHSPPITSLCFIYFFLFFFFTLIIFHPRSQTHKTERSRVWKYNTLKGIVPLSVCIAVQSVRVREVLQNASIRVCDTSLASAWTLRRHSQRHCLSQEKVYWCRIKNVVMGLQLMDVAGHFMTQTDSTWLIVTCIIWYWPCVSPGQYMTHI